MSTTSRIYPVLAALYTAYDQLSPGLLTVYRGKHVTDPAGDFLTVGWAPGVGSAVVGTQHYEGATRASLRSEDFTVTCYLETLTGDTDDTSILAREQRLFDYLDQIQALHRSDPQLGGALTGSAGYAEFSNFDFVPDETASGFIAGFVFFIAVNAQI